MSSASHNELGARYLLTCNYSKNLRLFTALDTIFLCCHLEYSEVTESLGSYYAFSPRRVKYYAKKKNFINYISPLSPILQTFRVFVFLRTNTFGSWYFIF
jgi:hypothetical protein